LRGTSRFQCKPICILIVEDKILFCAISRTFFFNLCTAKTSWKCEVALQRASQSASHTKCRSLSWWVKWEAQHTLTLLFLHRWHARLGLPTLGILIGSVDKTDMCKAIQSCDYHARHAFWPCIKVEFDSRCASYCSEMRRINTYAPMTCQHWYGKLISLHASRMDFLFQLVQPRRHRTDLPLAPRLFSIQSNDGLSAILQRDISEAKAHTVPNQ
jgi:hypothetical protein